MRVKSFCGCFSLRTGVLFIGWCTVIWAILSAIFFGFQFHDFYSSVRNTNGIMKIIAASMMIAIILVGFTGGLMVYGVHKKRHGLIFPWIARTTADFMIICAFCFGFIVFGPVAFRLAEYFIIVGILLTILVLQGYIWLVTYSYYIYLVAEKFGCAGSCTEVKKVPFQALNVYHHL